METIDGAVAAPTPGPPQVALRLVTTYDGATRRVDLALRGSRGTLVEDGVATSFPTERLWPVLRNLLPPLDQLRADPPPRPTAPGPLPGPTFADDCRALVVIATVVGDGTEGTEVGVRTWLATDDELYAVGNEPRRAEPGALAELLVWDVTAAMEALVRALEAAS
jgi:hypothetical protein